MQIQITSMMSQYMALSENKIKKTEQKLEN